LLADELLRTLQEFGGVQKVAGTEPVLPLIAVLVGLGQHGSKKSSFFHTVAVT